MVAFDNVSLGLRRYVSNAFFVEVKHMLKNPFKELSKFEIILWLTSMVVVTVAFLVPEEKELLHWIASLIGVTALIFVAKGLVLGQLLTVVFSVLYGIISFFTQYYGEMITYLCMSAPVAMMAVISWLRHPYQETKVVEVNRVKPRQLILITLLSIAVTIAFYFILAALGTANLWFSTLSVFTSFFASMMVFLRSPYYGLGYAANDVVLIILWVLASAENIAYIPMVFCFVMFLINDLYGFINWQRLRKEQQPADYTKLN